MPSVIVLSGGDSLSSMKEIVTVNIASTDRIVSLLSNMKEFLRYIEIAIKQCSRGGMGFLDIFKEIRMIDLLTDFCMTCTDLWMTCKLLTQTCK